LHGDHGEFSAKAGGFRDVEAARSAGGHAGEFAHGEAVDVGHHELSNSAEELAVEERSVDFVSAEWIRTIEDDDFDAVLEAGLERVLHDDRKRVGADADVLEIDEHRIEILELGLGGLAVFAVEGIGRQAGAFVDEVADVFAGGDLAVDAVFGTEEGDEFDVGSGAEDVDRGDAGAVYARRMGEEADAFTGDGSEVLCGEDIDAEGDGGTAPGAGKIDRRRGGVLGGGRDGRTFGAGGRGEAASRASCRAGRLVGAASGEGESGEEREVEGEFFKSGASRAEGKKKTGGGGHARQLWEARKAGRERMAQKAAGK
jgi:hypothetical protein